jgi:integrase
MMANKPGRRRFGNIRQLPSGRYQVRYRGHGGQLRSHAVTFARKTDADRALALIEAEIAEGAWTDPDRAKIKLADYADVWIAQRPGLRPRTVEIYRGLLRRLVSPYLGSVPLGKIDTPMIRDWRARLLDQGISVSETAKAYRFLRAVLMTAADDRIIPRNPCRVRGAGEEKSDERPTLTVRQVYELADRMPGNCHRVLVLLAAFASLRWGEITALRRCDIDIQAGTVTIARQHVQLDTGGVVVTAPKSRASARTVAIPAAILPAIRGHLDGCVGQSPDSLVFTGSRGGVLRRSNFRRAVKWSYTVEAVGVPGLHFHDLRHTGNTHAAATGASLRDLMDRMGHDSARAALIYQHKTAAAGRAIADALSAQIESMEQAHGDGVDTP